MGLGFLLAGSVLLFPLGLLLLPFVLIACAYVATHGPAWPEVLGLAAGMSAFTGLIAYSNRDNKPCPQQSTFVFPPGEAVEFSCGGTAPQPWALAALLLLALAIAGYSTAVVADRRRGRSATWE